MVEQAKHAFYVEDPCDERWSAVLHRKTIGVNIEDDDSTLESCLTPFSTQTPSNVNREEEVDDVLINRNDHDEGELINIYNEIYFIFTWFVNFSYTT